MNQLDESKWVFHVFFAALTTLPETNIAAENRPSQKEGSLPTIKFQVLC